MAGPATLAIAPAAIGAVAGFLGQRSSNRANRQEAQRNREFQERMRNTEWQAEVADMKKAGINPALAYSQGGASSPSGAVAASQESELGEGVSSALAVKTAQESFELLKEQRRVARAQAKRTQFEAITAGNTAEQAMARQSYYFTPEGMAKPALLELLEAEHGSSMANNARSVTELKLARFKEPEMKALADLFESVGAGGKGIQSVMPLIMQLLRGRN